MQDRAGRLGSYVGLLYAGDTSNPSVAKLYGDVQQAMTEIGAILLFFELELNRIDDHALDAALAASSALAHYRPWLTDLRKEKPHQLADEIETLFLEKSVTGAAAFNRLFDETMTGLRFRVGREELTLEPALNRLQDPSPKVRQAWALAISDTLSRNVRLFTLITNTLAKDREISDRWHRFAGIADSRHLSNRVEPEVVDALVAAVRAAYPRLSHRYYALKARWFGQDALDFWDRNAPLPDVVQPTYPWVEARDTVLDAYGRFSPELSGIARRFFDERWIDAEVREGKAPGAFSHPTVPSAHPYVLMNYQGRPRDVMTLAHELGHGVHQVLAAPNGALMAPTPLTLAETASVFGEMLTFRRLLDAAATPQRRKALIAQKVEDMINTVVRQIAFYSFELRVHEERRAGELTAERLGAIWMDVQSESLGPAVRLGEPYRVFWSYIPHFIHAPFYVYAYAFGDCLVNSLYAVYEKADPASSPSIARCSRPAAPSIIPKCSRLSGSTRATPASGRSASASSRGSSTSWRRWRKTSVVTKPVLCYTAVVTTEAAMKLELKKIGNSTGLILPKDLLARLGVGVGDGLYAKVTDDGLSLVVVDRDHDEAMRIAREVMDEYKDTFRELAK